MGVVALAELIGAPLGAVPRGVVENWPLRFPSVPETGVEAEGVVLLPAGPAYVGADPEGVVEYWPLRLPSVPDTGVVAFAELTGEPLGAVPYAGRDEGVVEN